MLIHAQRAQVGSSWSSNVLIEILDGTIRGVQTQREPPEGAVTAGAVIPGLVDAHCHLTFDGSPSAVPAPGLWEGESSPGVSRMYRSRLDTLAEAGVCGVRDLGSSLEATRYFCERGNDGQDPVPFVHFAGPPLTRRGGHLASMGTEIDDVAEVRAAVRRIALTGASWVKVMVTGGRMTPGTDPLAVEFPTEWTREVVERAHDDGLRVAAHALSLDGVVSALEAGVDTVEHGTLIERDGARPSVPAKVTDLFLSSGAVLSPTLLRREPPHPIPWEIRASWVHELHARGVPVLAGGDTGIGGVAHGSFAGVVTTLAETLSPVDAIAAATFIPGRFFGIDGAEIAVGRRAVLLELERDPRDRADVIANAIPISYPGTPSQE